MRRSSYALLSTQASPERGHMTKGPSPAPLDQQKRWSISPVSGATTKLPPTVRRMSDNLSQHAGTSKEVTRKGSSPTKVERAAPTKSLEAKQYNLTPTCGQPSSLARRKSTDIRISKQDQPSGSSAPRRLSLGGAEAPWAWPPPQRVLPAAEPRRVRLRISQEKSYQVEKVGGQESPPTSPLLRPPSQEQRRYSDSVLGVSGRGEGVVCSNSDLISLLRLTASACEITTTLESDEEESRTPKDVRSKSFDVAMLKGSRCNSVQGAVISGPSVASSWFSRRHQPLATRQQIEESQSPPKPLDVPVLRFETEDGIVTSSTATQSPASSRRSSKSSPEEVSKVVWDGTSGSVVDASMLGCAIETFLKRQDERRKSAPDTSGEENPAPKGKQQRSASWYATNDDEDAAPGDSSICSALKDLFVK